MDKLIPLDWQSHARAGHLRASLQEFGFAVLKNHPIDQSLVNRMYINWLDWFTCYGSYRHHDLYYQCRKKKLDYARGFTDNPHEGYFAVEDAESALGQEHQDYKEYYHIFESTIRNDFLPGIARNATGFYFAVARAFAEQVLELVEPDLYELARFSQNHLLRVLYYPKSVNGDNEERRAAAHTDINLLTLLPYSTKEGLQVKHRGKWIDVPNDPRYIVLNVGDAMMEATRGKYPSAEHRVYQEPYTTSPERMSLPFFLHARPDAELRPGLTAEAHLNQRLKELGVA